MDIKSKKLSKANLPFLIVIGSFLISILLIHISLPNFLLGLLFAPVFIILIISPFLCLIGLVLQILNKEKTILDKVMIGCNSIVITGLILIILTWVVLFGGLVNEKDVRKQISQEYSTLNKEYTPVLNYLAQYKKSNGVYPETINNKIIPNSEIFEFYKYSRNSYGKGYWLQVYPKNGPIEYYYNDENDNGYNYYSGDGFIDSAFDNYYYFEINDKWHAIALQHFSRHRHTWINLGDLERETDEWMKNNIDKFEEKGDKNK